MQAKTVWPIVGADRTQIGRPAASVSGVQQEQRDRERVEREKEGSFTEKEVWRDCGGREGEEKAHWEEGTERKTRAIGRRDPITIA